MIDVQLVLWLVVILYVWFDTEAFPEYAAAFRLKFFKGKEFLEARKKASYPLAYPDWLLIKHNNFIVRLVSCPTCFAVWLNILATCVFYNVVGVWSLGWHVLATWLGYYGCRKTLKKLYE